MNAAVSESALVVVTDHVGHKGREVGKVVGNIELTVAETHPGGGRSNLQFGAVVRGGEDRLKGRIDQIEVPVSRGAGVGDHGNTAVDNLNADVLRTELGQGGFPL